MLGESHRHQGGRFGELIRHSDLRQIPDNQEVFLSPNSDTSVVIEVLTMAEEGMAREDLWNAVK